MIKKCVLRCGVIYNIGFAYISKIQNKKALLWIESLQCVFFYWNDPRIRSPPPSILIFKKFQIGGKRKWLITKQEKNISGTYGKNKKKKRYGNLVFQKRLLLNCGNTIGAVLKKNLSESSDSKH